MSKMKENFASMLDVFMDAVQQLINALHDGEQLDAIRRLAATAVRAASDAERGEMHLIWGPRKARRWNCEVTTAMSAISQKLHGDAVHKDVLADLDQLIEKASPLIWS